jgi:N-acetylglutamate synthase-like GNAT family acetyltransferase
MSLNWIHESPAKWDDNKAAIVGGAPAGIFEVGGRRAGDLIPGDWWRVERDGKVVGYGWMDTTFGGDAEVLLAVHPDAQGSGVGTFILQKLEEEAAAHGLNYLYNVVSSSHPNASGLTRWLEHRRFKASHEGRLMRKVLAKR